MFAGVKVENLEKPEIFAGGLGAARAPSGSRAKPWPGVQGAGGPRKLIDFSNFKVSKITFDHYKIINSLLQF